MNKPHPDKRRNGNKTLTSQLEYSKRYDKEHMKLTGIKHKTEERQLWEEAAAKHNLSLSLFVRKCVHYCIEHDINISDDNDSKE